MLRRSRQQYSRGFRFLFRISRLTRHCLARCCNGLIVRTLSVLRLPKQQIRGPPEVCHILKCTVGHVMRSRLLGACFSMRSVSHRGHLQSICSSSSGSSPHNRHSGIPLSGSQTASFVSKHIHKEAHEDRFLGREEILVLLITLVVASLSMPTVDSMPLMSLRLFPAFSIGQASVLA